MNVTFLVGNGFDISMGFKTSYKDFYEWYRRQPIANHQDEEPVPEDKHVVPKDKDAISEGKDSITRLKGSLSSRPQLWSDFEIGLGAFTDSFQADDVESFIECYKDVVYHLNAYLSQIEEAAPVVSVTENDLADARKKILSFYGETSDQERRFFSKSIKKEQDNGAEIVFQFVSFNYTHFLDDFVKRLSQKTLATWRYQNDERKHTVAPKVFHVHGEISTLPIVGLSSKEQIKNPKFQELEMIRAALMKSESMRGIGLRRYDEMKEIIAKSTIICLWGLSLGASDKHIWKEIAVWLKEHPSHHLFIYQYTETPPGNVLAIERLQRMDKVRSAFLQYSEFAAVMKNQLKEKIHVIFNTQRVLVIPGKSLCGRQ